MECIPKCGHYFSSSNVCGLLWQSFVFFFFLLRQQNPLQEASDIFSCMLSKSLEPFNFDFLLNAKVFSLTSKIKRWSVVKIWIWVWFDFAKSDALISSWAVGKLIRLWAVGIISFNFLSFQSMWMANKKANGIAKHICGVLNFFCLLNISKWRLSIDIGKTVMTSTLWDKFMYYSICRRNGDLILASANAESHNIVSWFATNNSISKCPGTVF